MSAFLFIGFWFALLSMADFPPNLEDGEQWLPSDIYQAIVSDFDLKPKDPVDDITQDLAKKIESFEHGGKAVVLKEQKQKSSGSVDLNYGEAKGTGVFIPRITQKTSEVKSSKKKGTGVFLQSLVTDALTNVPSKKTTSAINGRWKGRGSHALNLRSNYF